MTDHHDRRREPVARDEVQDDDDRTGDPVLLTPPRELTEYELEVRHWRELGLPGHPEHAKAIGGPFTVYKGGAPPDPWGVSDTCPGAMDALIAGGVPAWRQWVYEARCQRALLLGIAPPPPLSSPTRFSTGGNPIPLRPPRSAP